MVVINEGSNRGLKDNILMNIARGDSQFVASIVLTMVEPARAVGRVTLKAAQVPAETMQLNGPPIRLIVEQAKDLGAHYIVMGSHGHTALYDLLVGSTTHGVLMRAGCPVVITPGPKAVVKGAGK